MSDKLYCYPPDYTLLKNIPEYHQTNELYLESVKQDASALEFIKNLSKENEFIYLYAIKQDGLALRFVKNQTNKICIEAELKSYEKHFGWFSQLSFSLQFLYHLLNAHESN